MNQRGNREHEAPVRGDPMRPAKHQVPQGRLVSDRVTEPEKDALEELNLVADECEAIRFNNDYVPKISHGKMAELIRTAIAAWEKERAEALKANRSLSEGCRDRDTTIDFLRSNIAALRREVRDALNELRGNWAFVPTLAEFNKFAARLDKALQGE